MKSFFLNQAPEAALCPLESLRKTSVGKIVLPQEGQGHLPVDVYENERELLVVAPIAGADPETTEIVVMSDVLSIRGRRASHAVAMGFRQKEAYLSECFWGTFSRSVVLPSNVDAERIEATQKHQVLYIRIPKRTSIHMRIVRIK